MFRLEVIASVVAFMLLVVIIAVGMNDGITRRRARLGQKRSELSALHCAIVEPDAARLARLEHQVLSDPREWIREAEQRFDREHAPPPLYGKRPGDIYTAQPRDVMGQGSFREGLPPLPPSDPGERASR